MYVKGDYNANGSFAGTHSYAAVIADTVTLLSSNWDDDRSLNSPYTPSGRPAATSWFRMAVASGKGLFPSAPGHGNRLWNGWWDAPFHENQRELELQHPELPGFPGFVVPLQTGYRNVQKPRYVV